MKTRIETILSSFKAWTMSALEKGFHENKDWNTLLVLLIPALLWAAWEGIPWKQGLKLSLTISFWLRPLVLEKGFHENKDWNYSFGYVFPCSMLCLRRDSMKTVSVIRVRWKDGAWKWRIWIFLNLLIVLWNNGDGKRARFTGYPWLKRDCETEQLPLAPS